MPAGSENTSRQKSSRMAGVSCAAGTRTLRAGATRSPSTVGAQRQSKKMRAS